MSVPERERPFSTALIGGVPFVIAGPEEAAAWFVREVGQARPWNIRLANAYCVTLASRTPQYSALLNDDGLNLPDGAPIAAALRIVRGQPEARQIRGADFMRQVFLLSDATGPRHFLVGGTPGLLEALARELMTLNPSAKIVGSYAPPFGPLTEEFVSDIRQMVARGEADIVWIGLGTPKQDFVSRDLARTMPLSAVGVGAAFDFIAGSKNEAPRWMRVSGLEWLHRLLAEPGRLWRRYLIGNGHFLILLVRDALRTSRDR